MVRIAINGLGRIGRNFLRIMMQDKEALKKIEVAVVNIGPANPDTIAHMFKYDTIMGTYPGTVEKKGDYLVIDGCAIKIMAECSLQKNCWGENNIDWVIDSSGRFTHREKAMQHIQAGAKKVLITAPAKNEDIAIVPGVNGGLYDAEQHTIVSLGSCSTNAFMPMLKALNNTFGVEQGFMSSIHSYTNTQVLLDVEASDLRRSRAAALNIIPTTTGAAKMVGKVLPELQGKIQAMAIRVPIARCSFLDFTFRSKQTLSVDGIHKAFAAVMQADMKGIVDLSMEPLVSSDFGKNEHSVVIDGLLTQAEGNMAKVFGWYDNEWGYSCRIKDFLLNIAE